jgi:hypothetical protein
MGSNRKYDISKMTKNQLMMETTPETSDSGKGPASL